MSYVVKRLNPFWITHPIVPTLVAIGGILGVIGYQRQMTPVWVIGAAVTAVGIFLAARPAISLLLATVGFIGGLVQFVVAPALNASTYTALEKAMSISFYTVFYAVLMDAVILVVSVLYNFYAGAIGFGGLRVELESVEEETAA